MKYRQLLLSVQRSLCQLLFRADLSVSVMLLLALIITWSGVFVLWLWMKPRHQSPPIFPGGLPLLGNVCQMLGDHSDFWNKEKKVYEYALKCNGVAVVKFFTHPFYVIADPDDGLLVANTCLAKPHILYYRYAEEMYRKGLVTTNVPMWKPHRKLLNPAFNQQVLNSYLDVFNGRARALVTEIDAEANKDVIDFEMCLSNYLIKTACQTTLGLSTDEDYSLIKSYGLASRKLFENYHDSAINFLLYFQFFYNFSSLKKIHDKLVKTLKGISTEVIRRKLESKQMTKNRRDDATAPDKFQPLLDRMLYLAETQGSFTVDEIQDHVNTIISAAYDTTARSLLFTLILIGSHEDVQSRIIQELNEVFEEEDRNVNKSDLPKLVYLEAVIKETLRLYPPAPRIARLVTSDVKMRQYTLPAGSSCIISVHAINRHPMWGVDADQFRPERWLNPASLPKNPDAFATFSLGKRNCIGKTYAMMLLKTTLVHVLRHYRIISTSQNLQTRCDVLQSPEEGHQIKIQPRKLAN